MSNQYRKKPVVIEAVQWAPEPDDYVFGCCVLPSWLRGALERPTGVGALEIREDGCVYVATLEGEMCASPGDWIIRGVKGELYPCKPDIFAATYEAVTT